MEELVITVRGGRVEFVYDDRLADLLEPAGGRKDRVSTVVRASHVEPADCGGWLADMAPSGGPVLGPFPLRAEALAAERAWLSVHRGL